MDIRELADKSVVEVTEAASNFSRLKGFSLRSLKGAMAITVGVVKHVEEIGLRDGLAGADKQALAVELVLRVAKLPFWLEPVARAVLPYVVDAVVDALKDKFGK